MPEEVTFEQVLRELSKTEELEKQNAQLQKQVDEQSKAIETLKKGEKEVKEKTGIEEGGKEKNVIGAEKLPATLTTSEKKRYQNIGKEFIDGAGDQFQKILKGVKFKSMMSTMREKFTAGIDKIKGFVKKAKEKKWFFAKLIAIAALLGVIIHHFKEKILGVIPNLGEYINDLFKKGKDWIAESLSATMTWLGDGISNMFERLISTSFKELKSLVNTFFTDTLPNAVVQLYLGILSAFSDDAANLLTEEDKRVTQEMGSQIADAAEAQYIQSREEANVFNSIKELYNRFETDEEFDQSAYNKLRGNTAVIALEEDKESDKFYSSLSDLIDSDLDTNIKDMINQGKINANILFSSLSDKMQDNNLTRQEAYDALRASFNDVNDAVNLKISGDGNKSIDFIDGFRRLINASRAKDAQFVEKRNEHLKKEEEKKKELENIKKTVTSIDAANIIHESLQNAFIELINAIKAFIDGDKISSQIKNSLTETNEKFVAFFNSFNGYISNVIDKVKEFFQKQHSYLMDCYQKFENIIASLKLSEDQKKQIKGIGVESVKPSQYTINVSVNFSSDWQNNGKKNLISDVVSIDRALNDSITNSNEYLQGVIDALNGISIVTETKDQLNLQKVEDVIGELKENDQKLGQNDTELKGEISKINAILESLGKANNAASDHAAESAVGLD